MLLFLNTQNKRIRSDEPAAPKRSQISYYSSPPIKPPGSQEPHIPSTAVAPKPARVDICDFCAFCGFVILRPPMSTPNQAPTIVIRASPQISAIRLVLAVIAGLIALVLGLLVLLVIGIETGPVALLLGLVTATIPVPLYVVLVLWIDRYEAEPLWMLATAFFWGALIATFFAFLLNTTSHGIVGALADATAADAFAAVVSAPIVEEIGKAVILLIFFFWKKD